MSDSDPLGRFASTAATDSSREVDVHLICVMFRERVRDWSDEALHDAIAASRAHFAIPPWKRDWIGDVRQHNVRDAAQWELRRRAEVGS